MVGPDDSQPRVFLSYTRDRESDELRQRLVKALGDAGFEPWRGVPPAREAGPARDAFVAAAKAAVMIVSTTALGSEWMQAEADLLRRRALGDPAFRLVVVRNPDVPVETLDAWIGDGAPNVVVIAEAEHSSVEQIVLVLEALVPLAAAIHATPPAAGATLLSAGDHAGGVHAVACAVLDGRPCVVTGDGVGTLRVIDLARDELRLELANLHAGFVGAIAVGTLDGVAVSVSGGYDGTLRIVDLVDARVIADEHRNQDPVGGLALVDAPDGLLVIRGCNDGMLRFWDPRHAELDTAPTRAGHEGRVAAVAVTSDGDRLVAVSGGEDRRVRLWDVLTGEPIGEPRRGHTGAVQALVTTALGGRPIAVSGGEEGTLRVWEIADGGPLGEPLQAHEGGVLALAATAAGPRSLAVSAGRDNAVRVWDIGTHELVGEWQLGSAEAAGALAIGSLGERRVIVTGGADGRARLFDLPGGPDGAPAQAPPGTERDDRVEWVSDARADIDLLQRKPLAHTLATRLRRLRADDPGRSFLIHIDGRWGSGKSTLLDLLKKDLAGEWLVVEFDAWRQMRVGPPWWALLASLRQAVRRDMGRRAAIALRIAEAWQRMHRGGALYLIAVSAVLLVALGVALLLGTGLDLGAVDNTISSILAVTAGLGALYAATSGVGRFLLWDSAAGARVFEQSHRDPMESVADHFAWLIARAGRPVVFFVDDLDRCANEYVVDLLDCVQTLIRDAPGRIDDERRGERACHVIVAADGRWIRTSYEHAHAEFADAVEEPGRPLGYLFLDKIFQLTVPVPSISPQRQAAYLQALLRVKQNGDGVEEHELEVAVDAVKQQVQASTSEAEALEAFDGASLAVRAEVVEAVVGKLAEPQIEQGTQHRLERFAGLLETNPRAMKLVLNAYGIARALQVIEDNVVPGDALALWTILRVRWPALADYVRNHPEAIEALAEGTAPDDAPPQLKALFASREVQRIVRCDDGGPMSAATIRACCGIAEEAPVSPPLRAGRP